MCRYPCIRSDKCNYSEPVADTAAPGGHVDAVHLLSQVFRLEEVAQVGISEVGGNLVNVQKALINL